MNMASKEDVWRHKENLSKKKLAKMSLASFLLFFLLLCSLSLLPATPVSPQEQQQDGVTVTVATQQRTPLSPNQELTLTVSVTNQGEEEIPAGKITIEITRAVVQTMTELTNWLHSANDEGKNSLTVSTEFDTKSIPANSSKDFATTIPVDRIGLTQEGIYGLKATFTVNEKKVGTGKTCVIWNKGTPAKQVALSFILPLTTPPSSSGLLSDEELSRYTGENGILTQQLNAAIGRPATIALDPRIIVSIRVLGTAAPSTALKWLARLSSAQNPIFALSYADSDLAIQHQAGAEKILDPISFEYAMDLENFQKIPTPDPFFRTADQAKKFIPAKTDQELPTTSELLSWPYTVTGIAWPGEKTVMTDDLEFFSRSGLTTSILGSENLTTDQTTLDSATSFLGSSRIIIMNSFLTEILTRAIMANSENSRNNAITEMAAALAILSHNQNTQNPLVVGLSRAASPSADAVLKVLDTLKDLPWISEVPLSRALEAEPAPGVKILDSPENTEQVSSVAKLFFQEQQVQAFAPVIDKPELITGKERASLLAALARSWATDSEARTSVLIKKQEASASLLSSVRIVDGSAINLLANSAEIPISLSNDLDYRVNVTLRVTPSNGRLLVESKEVILTIEANSRKTTKIPVEAAVANGDVNLRLELFNRNSTLISQAAPLKISVNADWEGWGTLTFTVFVCIFLVFSITRFVIKRRKLARDEHGE